MKNLKEIRIKKKMTREELCVAADVKYLTLRAYENQVREPKVSTARSLARALDVTVEELG